MCGVLAIKTSLNTPFIFCYLLFSSVGVSLARTQKAYLDSLFHCTSFQFGKHPGGYFWNVHQRWLPCVQGKSPNENAENEVSMTCYAPQHGMTKLTPKQFHCNFPLSLCIESSCLPFSNFFQPLVSVKFNFELKFLSSNICVILGLNFIHSFILTSLTFGNFCHKSANASLSLTVAFTDILNKSCWLCSGGK